MHFSFRYHTLHNKSPTTEISREWYIHRVFTAKVTAMSDNEYDGGDGGEGYDVFAQEDDDQQIEEPETQEEADIEIVYPDDTGVSDGLREADQRITTKYMTKYERARILGTRALQIR